MVYPATPFTQFIVQLQKKEKVHLGPVILMYYAL